MEGLSSFKENLYKWKGVTAATVARPYLPLYMCSLVFPSLHIRINRNPGPFVGKCSSYEHSFFNVYLFIFEREREQGRVREKERETGDRESQADSMLSAQSPVQGLNPQTMRS